jgi:maltose alpha-D-glucosyltransferase/alpha-amylase
MARRRKESTGMEDDHLWYKDAIIYELHIRAFADSDADGVGDFLGLIDKLDYLEDLGINAIWLLPFYPSPLKDDGYDISDYNNILPVYGTMSHFKTFVDEAHRHGIRVITELVMNHTSDQHPWFQRARKSPPGSRYRDFYVWSDTAEKYRETRIIFKDYETSNWTWDPVVKQYYWHRFYHHQPDLNYDNPALRKALFRVMDFWLKLGVDGMRADAVPYLYEREGTNCENLPETHDFLKELRAHIDKKFRNRMLLAEANQWPEDAVAYFGQGDEFHTAFHFPIMPRLFMALRMEDRFPIIDILQQTPDIPEACQWVLFLRNHDELTLEMVTDEERDYMYRVYATDPTARINLGIRRRLAPLLSNDRKKIELMNSLLFSLPGTPVIYYGDEIGMGDNFYLGDRNGVRTPMQWSPERNAGFSRTNPQRLYLPPIIDPEYHYEAVNVENQLNNPDSLLWWMKRIIALRKRYKAFGHGNIEFLNPENRKVLTYLRRHEQENILVVANLSHLAQQTQLDLSEFNGWHPVDLFGRVEFAPITDDKYYFTLSPYAFYWFSLEPQPAEVLQLRTRPSEQKREVPVMRESEESLFGVKRNWFIMEAVLLDYIKSRRWFRGKARDAWAAEIQDIITMRQDGNNAYIVLFQVDYLDGEPETYAIPIATLSADHEDRLNTEYANAVIARLQRQGRLGETILFDAMLDADFCKLLLSAITYRRSFKGKSGEIKALPTRVFRRIRGPAGTDLTPSVMNVEQSNTSVMYGNQLILKLFRRLEDGINPDVEIGGFLTENTPFANISYVAGSLEYHRGRKKPISLAILESFVPNEGDAWQYTLDFLARYFEEVLAHATVQAPPISRKHMLSMLKEPPPLAKETIGTYLISAHLLGQRTAELHIALSSDLENPDFAPEPYTLMYQTSLYQSLRGYAIRTMQLLKGRLRYLPVELHEDAGHVLDLQDKIIERYNLVRRQKINAARIRCHGDYHLGQVLHTGSDFVITDFEGEPARSLSERRLKRSPLRDIAGMIRSFHYATHSALNNHVPLLSHPENELPLLQHWAHYWYTWVSVEYLNAYLDIMSQTGLLPDNPDHVKIMLDAFLLDKALYEVSYELNNRPDWLKVPVQGILQLMEAED